MITLPTSFASGLTGKSIYAMECSGTTCPLSSSDIVVLTPTGTGGTTLTVSAQTFQDITGFSTTPITLVLYTLPTVTAVATSAPTSAATSGPLNSSVTFPTVAGTALRCRRLARCRRTRRPRCPRRARF